VRYRNLMARMLGASKYSLQGLSYALAHEQAFQYEAAVFVIVCVVLVVLDLPALWSVILAGAWVSVMCLELVNSAAEKAFDLITENYHPLVKAGKDMLSASIFLAVFFNVFAWVIAIIVNIL